MVEEKLATGKGSLCAISPSRTETFIPLKGRKRPGANLRASAFRCALLVISRTVPILERQGLPKQVEFSCAVDALQLWRVCPMRGKKALSLPTVTDANDMPAVVPQCFSSAQLTCPCGNIIIREKMFTEHKWNVGPIATHLFFQSAPGSCGAMPTSRPDQTH